MQRSDLLANRLVIEKLDFECKSANFSLIKRSRRCESVRLSAHFSYNDLFGNLAEN